MTIINHSIVNQIIGSLYLANLLGLERRMIDLGISETNVGCIGECFLELPIIIMLGWWFPVQLGLPLEHHQ